MDLILYIFGGAEYIYFQLISHLSVNMYIITECYFAKYTSFVLYWI
jgi:hypothetical protein